ncbi:3'(2'),5'-bisphosphate nucleotidase CysQ [Sphingoaurantiacus capsulatus]|uniref:3'(2'),5'-bisphosphate nucleotidase CysQ n=1 Tax=Sphingoaurantiacus capsulatus TaxID=1771310 RepID=A0ABV7XCW8_9SPHN
MTAPPDPYDAPMHSRLIDALALAVREAGELVERIRLAGFVSRDKADASPVTEADEQAEILLTAAIAAADPGALIVGEEACAAGVRPDPTARFWLIDPVDGTKDFIAGGPDYSVNVALIDGGVPMLGLVLAPRSGMLWAGAIGVGAFRQAADGAREPIATRAMPTAPVVVTSRSHLDDQTRAYCAAIPNAQTRPSGSSLKFCLLAEGSADVYPRFGPTSEWDTAAGDAVLRAAGGTTRHPDGRDFSYGKAEFLNGAFLAVGEPDSIGRLPPLS